jgi:hypothetical protein
MGDYIARVIKNRSGVQDRVQVENIVVINHPSSLFLLSVWSTDAMAPPGGTGREFQAVSTIGAYAALPSSCCAFPAGAPVMAIRRGFIASGISRSNSIVSKPLSKLALFTCT